MHPLTHSFIVQAHLDELRRAAATHALRAEAHRASAADRPARLSERGFHRAMLRRPVARAAA